MNVLEPYNISSIDFNNIVFKNKKIINNKKVIFLKYNNKSNNFVFQISKLNNPYIINSNEIEFKIDNNIIIDFLNNLDNFIIDEVKNKSNEMFDHIDDLSSINYKRILSNNNTIKLKNINNDNFKTNILLNDEKISNFSEINNNITCKVILEVYAIWIKNNNFGLLLRSINIGINEIQNKYNYKFLEDSEEINDYHNIYEDSDLNQENNRQNNNKDHYESYNNQESDKESDQESDQKSDQESDQESDKESDQESDQKSDQESEKKNKNNVLFIKNKFNNKFINESTSSSDSININLNKLILGKNN
jgi:hypothetical protein